MPPHFWLCVELVLTISKLLICHHAFLPSPSMSSRRLLSFYSASALDRPQLEIDMLLFEDYAPFPEDKLIAIEASLGASPPWAASRASSDDFEVGCTSLLPFP